jgi:hypothetical protein
MLSEIDDPVSILFIVEESAAMQRRSEASGSFSPFAHGLASNWWRLQERGMSMSNATRAVLQRLWLDPGAEKQVRRQASNFGQPRTGARTSRYCGDPIYRRTSGAKFCDNVWYGVIRRLYRRSCRGLRLRMRMWTGGGPT